MGNGETGGTAALPAWIGYMSKALKDVPQSVMSAPSGLVAMEVAGSGKGPTKEYFYQENVPVEPQPEPPQDENAKPVD